MPSGYTPEKFAELRRHLSDVDKPLEDFCHAHGFTERTTALGRYPRRRIHRYGDVNLFFDLQMDLNTDGHRFERFTPDLPYSLSAGAWLDISTDRFGMTFSCFAGLPFAQVKEVLATHLESAFQQLLGWDSTRLMKEGKKTTISSTSHSQ